MRVWVAFGFWVGLGLQACGTPAEEDPDIDPSPAGALSLIRQDGWRPVSEAEDVLRSHRPESVACASGGWTLEADITEMDTRNCNYISIQQPITAEILAQDDLRLVMTHEQLQAPEPALAHIALLLDSEVVWEVKIPIPGAPQLYDVTRTIARTIPAETPVVLHLHNHGLNTYRLYRLERIRKP